MEKITDNNFTLLTENRVFTENCDVKLINSSIEFGGEGNTICFVGENKSTKQIVTLEKCRINCKGNNNLIFIHLSKFPLKLVITLGHGCNIYIGRDFWSTTAAYLMANEKTTIHIGDGALFARNVWMRTSDMHLIYDIESKKRINPNKDIYVGDHVWIGQDVGCLKGTVIGDGGVIGWGSLCTGEKTKSVNSIYTGRPAQLVRTGITWRHKGTNQITEDDIKCLKYDNLTDDKYIYEDTEMEKKLMSFRQNVQMLQDMENRIAFLKKYDARNI